MNNQYEDVMCPFCKKEVLTKSYVENVEDYIEALKEMNVPISNTLELSNILEKAKKIVSDSIWEKEDKEREDLYLIWKKEINEKLGIDVDTIFSDEWETDFSLWDQALYDELSSSRAVPCNDCLKTGVFFSIEFFYKKDILHIPEKELFEE